MKWPVAYNLNRRPGDVEHPEIVGNRDIGAAVDIDCRVIIAPECVQTRVSRREGPDVAGIIHRVDPDKIIIVQEVIPDLWKDSIPPGISPEIHRSPGIIEAITADLAAGCHIEGIQSPGIAEIPHLHVITGNVVLVIAFSAKIYPDDVRAGYFIAADLEVTHHVGVNPILEAKNPVIDHADF